MKKSLTLVEVLISAAIMSIIGGAVMMALYAGNLSWRTDMGSLDLQQETRRAMESIVRELRQSAVSEIINVGSEDINFRIPDESGNYLYQIRYYLDSGFMIREYDGEDKIVGGNIESLAFSIDSDVVDIAITAFRQVRQGAVLQPIRLTLRERVKLRN